MAQPMPVTKDEHDGYLDTYEHRYGTREGALPYDEYRAAVDRLVVIYETPWGRRDLAAMRTLEERILA